MALKKNLRKKERGLPEALLMGLAGGAIITLLGTGLLAYLIGNETLSISGMNPACIVIHLVGSAVTGLVAYGMIKRQRVIVCALSALCYFILQLGVTALVFDGQYQGVGAGIIAIVGGGVLSILPGFIRRGSGGKRVKFKAFR